MHFHLAFCSHFQVAPKIFLRNARFTWCSSIFYKLTVDSWLCDVRFPIIFASIQSSRQNKKCKCKFEQSLVLSVSFGGGEKFLSGFWSGLYLETLCDDSDSKEVVLIPSLRWWMMICFLLVKAIERAWRLSRLPGSSCAWLVLRVCGSRTTLDDCRGCISWVPRGGRPKRAGLATHRGLTSNHIGKRLSRPALTQKNMQTARSHI